MIGAWASSTRCSLQKIYWANDLLKSLRMRLNKCGMLEKYQFIFWIRWHRYRSLSLTIYFWIVLAMIIIVEITYFLKNATQALVQLYKLICLHATRAHRLNNESNNFHLMTLKKRFIVLCLLSFKWFVCSFLFILFWNILQYLKL